MKPSVNRIRAIHPDLDAALVKEHLQRLEDRYFHTFSVDEIGGHLRALSSLSESNPVAVRFRPAPDGQMECTLVAFDHPSELSLITGILSSHGFQIHAGDIFTYARQREPAGRLSSARRMIIDHFTGRGPAEATESWVGKAQARFREVFQLLERRDPESLTEAKRQVNELVAQSLSSSRLNTFSVLYPMHIEVDEAAGLRVTRIKVLTEDTPFFLYAFCTAVSLRSISIEHVSIRTRDNRIEDEFELVDSQKGDPLSEEAMKEVKLSLLLTKQFTYFLGQAPDPFTSLMRFENLIEDILKLPEQGRLFDLLSNPKTMEDLAKILGTSDFLWEDFFRLHYENLIPLLGSNIEREALLSDPSTMASRLETALATLSSVDEKARRLNLFKDRESYLIDLDHILNPLHDFRLLSQRLTSLAEITVAKAIEMVYEKMVSRHGFPQTVAGLTARHAVLGLGKLGGQALGYASDIEFLFVYSDSGNTAGISENREGRVDNAEFFEQLVRDSAALIKAKREGIFRIDLRLRPYGKDGPLACSLDSFCRYYGKGGAAHSYEKLALVRLRAFAGDFAFGAMIERLRDKMVYASQSVNLDELMKLRKKQIAEKTRPGQPNAKYSPGGLVDLEYAVQILQVIHGEEKSSLRTPSIHQALEGLQQAGVIDPNEAYRLVFAYRFLRKLINALRMLRGSAQDLFLPAEDSIEFVHLARRMGYVSQEGIPPETALSLDFETATASVRNFVEQHFGRGSWPGTALGNVADLVLADSVSPELSQKILVASGFSDPQRAMVNLRSLAGNHKQRDLFAKLAVLACDMLEREPDPDMALNNWERFARAVPDREGHYEILLSQPMRLEILLGIFSVSQFLADTLISHPSFFEGVTRPDEIHKVRSEQDFRSQLLPKARSFTSREEWLKTIRIYRKREMLRIGARDLCLRKPIQEIITELSRLASALIQVALDTVWADHPAGPLAAYDSGFCVLAFGKLGGMELNYSSDVDLLGLFRLPPGASEQLSEEVQTVCTQVMERLRSDLSTITEEGYVYRVDLRLRPYGRSGALVMADDALVRYYRTEAEPWELQALLKARPVAGSRKIGDRVLRDLQPMLLEKRDKTEIWSSIKNLREKATQKTNRTLLGSTNVKEGAGGIRDIEFLVQGLQLINAHGEPALLCGNTAEAITLLERHGILDAGSSGELRDDYFFLRRVEHHLQVQADQQIHVLPAEPSELNALARRILGPDGDADKLQRMVTETMDRVSEAVQRHRG